ncbi:sensor histidine kinase [Gudongella sp. DL1XJH-153]|uniref:sensor histidine kinase n=1 Tax=Gudongella sp. DL1XJH-153 TaxID=3409804 RepID=UPI003BB6A4D6
MRRSIKSRLIKNFMLIILVTVIFLEILLITGIRNHYYKNVEDILTSQIEFSTNFYARYFSSGTLEGILIEDTDIFWQHTAAQVQILDLEGNILMDSLGINFTDKIETPDIQQALNEGRGVWTGNVSYDDEPVMAVAMPIESTGDSIGIIRFISSMEETNNIINQISQVLILIGLLVVTISGFLSLFLANSIVKPLKEVTEVAEKMADGQFKVRSEVRVNDEIGRLSHTLNYMAEEITRKENMKNDFISSISHELRTPLTSIKGWAITLKDYEELSRDILMDGLEIIEAESDRLTGMVEELLDFSRFTSGRIALVKDTVDIKDILKTVVYQMMPRALNNNIDFNVDIDDDISPILGDENRIRQVLINLLDNAFKFTGEGEVDLIAYEDKEYLFIEIKDNGPGIPEEELPYVKDKFFKGKNSKSHSGIGLSICDEIIGLHDGVFRVESNAGEGTTAIVGFPREVSA